MLGGKLPRRGGRLTGPVRDRSAIPDTSPQLTIVTILACLFLGIVGGFVWGHERQLRGGLLAQREEARQRADWVTLDGLPDEIVRAFVLVTDPRLVGHGSWHRTDVQSLPRHLVRQIHLLDTGVRGRTREMVMAPLVELHYSPEEIVEFYLNRVDLGASDDFTVHGLYHAANEYMRKEPRDLTLGEAATLAGLLLPPRLQDPRAMAGSVGARRNEVLRVMLEAGEISAAQYQEALAEALAFQPGVAELPMSMRIPSVSDTAVIRIPPGLGATR